MWGWCEGLGKGDGGEVVHVIFWYFGCCCFLVTLILRVPMPSSRVGQGQGGAPWGPGNSFFWGSVAR